MRTFILAVVIGLTLTQHIDTQPRWLSAVDTQSGVSPVRQLLNQGQLTQARALVDVDQMVLSPSECKDYWDNAGTEAENAAGYCEFNPDS